MIGWSDDLGVTSDPEEFAQAIARLRSLSAVDADTFEELDTSEQRRAFRIAEVADASIAQEVLDALDRALVEGTTFEDFADEVEGLLDDTWAADGPGLETIFRTNLLTAYNHGRYDVFTSPEVQDARPYWRYDAIDDERTDDECAECDGTVLEADDDWWGEHIPPLHFSCRCSFVALTPEEAADEGIDDEGPDADAAKGFGGAPDQLDDEYEIDPERFDPDIAEGLADD